MIANLITYSIIRIPKYYDFMSWKGVLVMFVLTCLVGMVMFALSNIVLKSYPPLSKNTTMSDVHYSETYNQKYIKQSSLLNKLRQIKFSKLFIVLVLVLMFIFIRYYTLAFNDFSFYWF